ncbi:zinc ABC transporter substrate-binding protein [Aestuariibius sp. 2305UL40-4]|uniref:zinc ABC transporter substrate-binding protein n=1 Tax=Aestuariibius violaceus TaxID=3234132 RepID=UPI00345E72E0
MRLLALIATCAGGTAFAETPRVVTDILPVHSLAAAVMEGAGTPTLLLGPGTDPHHAALKPSQAESLQEADIVLWMGHGLTPWLEEPIETLAGNADVLELADTEGAVTHEMRGDHDDHGHGHGHDHGDTDPHGWLDPVNARLWLELLADTLAGADPDNATLYRSNAARAITDIDAVTAEIRTRLDGAQGAVLVGHDSLQYFEQRFGLAHAGSLTDASDAAPGSSHIREMREIAGNRTTACLLTDPETSADLVATITDGTDLPVIPVDPLGTDLDQGPGLYPALLRGIGAAYATCLTSTS